MALLQVNFYSSSLNGLTSFNALLPSDVPEEMKDPASYQRPVKALYLLHGYTGNYMDWITGTKIKELSEKYNLAVIMPSGNNSFYLDDTDKGELVSEYVGKELVEQTRKMFGLSEKKEDTFIGGLSMGGYGALRTGLKYDCFGRIIALSSALILHKVAEMKPDAEDAIADYRYYQRVFGDLGKLLESDRNPEVLIRTHKAQKKEIPAIYMACGTEDFLFDENLRFHEFLTAEKVGHVFDRTPGIHNWDFWNEQIQKAVPWALGI